MASTTTAPPRPTCREETPAAPEGAGLASAHPVESSTRETDVDHGRSLVFRAAGRVYACDVAAVREVVPLDARARLTRLPGAPRSVVGLLNVRGKIVTVVDAGGLLHGVGLDASRAGAHAMALIVDCGVRGVGLAVERVTDVRALRAEEGYSQLDVRALARDAVVITEE